MKLKKLDNVGLRLIALLLAIVLYYALKDSDAIKNSDRQNDRTIFR
jgi:YbbR domain-containing protein